MSLIGIIGEKKDIQAIKKEIKSKEIEIIEITKKTIENLKNVQFSEIIIMKDIKLEKQEYKYMSQIISKTKCLILNADLEIRALQEIETDKPIKVITIGFNSKATITISSVKEDKIVISVQRNIKKDEKEIIELQEKEIKIEETKNKKIYNQLIVFIIKELHNL